MLERPSSARIAVAVVLGVVWWYPELLSATGIALVVAWAYGVLFARLLRVAGQQAVMHWGVNRWGVISLSIAMMIVGAYVMYYGYDTDAYLAVGAGWVLLFAGYDTARASYKGKMANLRFDIVVQLQYLVVALLTLALFGGYIDSSPLGQENITYQGVAGESLVLVAWVIAVCEIVHYWTVYSIVKLEKMLKR